MKLMKIVLMGMGLVTVSSAFAAVESVGPGIILESSIAVNGDSASIRLRNNNDDPMYCDGIDVELKMADGEFDQSIGNIKLSFQNVYVKALGAVSETGLGQSQVSELRLNRHGAKISNISAIPLGCRKAVFEDYCEYAPLSDDEKFTIESLKTAFGLRRCGAISSQIKYYLRLRNAKIKNVAALAFFDQLQTLELDSNQITDARPLAKLNDLRYLSLNGNPISEVDALLQLPLIRRICVARTPLYASKKKLQLPLSTCY